ncbi:MAG: hypothetical protein JNL98_38735 [Bryobacterales bacterium]|nr:hypothetical protein [Bryobacterales bacterium]
MLEGEGAVHRMGSIAYTGATVRIVDATGTPVPGARVTFQLPSEGATGVFANGGLTEEADSGADGQASVWGIRWSTVPGPSTISVVARLGEFSAGTAVRVQVVPASGVAVTAPRTSSPRQLIPRHAGPVPTAPAEVPAAEATSTTAAVHEQPPASPPQIQPQAASPAPAIRARHSDAAPAAASFEVAIQDAMKHAPKQASMARPTQPSFEVEVNQRSAIEPASMEETSSMVATQNRKPGVILSPTLEPIGSIDGPRSKWLWIGLGLAGAIGAGFAYRMMQQRTPTAPAAAAVTAPSLSLSQPTITIGKP